MDQLNSQKTQYVCIFPLNWKTGLVEHKYIWHIYYSTHVHIMRAFCNHNIFKVDIDNAGSMLID